MATDVATYDPPLISLPLTALTFQGFRRWWWSGEIPDDVRVAFLRDRVLINLLWHEHVSVPVTARKLSGFRRWARSDDFPRRGRISFAKDRILIDMSPEEIETHNKVKTTVTSTVYRMVERFDLGTLYSDRVMVTHDAAGLSAEPDAAFATWDSLRSGRVRPVPRKGFPREFIELSGSPDWVLEIISRRSPAKDKRTLGALYHAAQVREYWLINALGEEIDFRVFTYRSSGFVMVKPKDGWLRSRVFGHYFRLQRSLDPLGYWRYTLKVRKV
jgi:Uma2 family endonuclease